MTGFADLPNELILALWRQVLDPDAVESFALTSKKIYALGSSFIKEHNELRARFSSIPYFQDHMGSNLARILKALLQNPRAALYVRSFRTDGWSEWEYSNNPETPGHRPYPEDTVELFRQSIKKSPFILEDEIDFWLNALEIEDEGAILSLILTMLPNVRLLELYRVRSAESLLLNIIKRITVSQDTEALSRLTKVRLSSGAGFRSEEFDWVRTFVTLPSVRAIEAWSIGPDCNCRNHDFPNDSCISECYGPDEHCDCHHDICHERRLALLPKTSAVTHLTFFYCVINTKRLYRILQGLRALESFEYINSDVFSAPNEIVDALLTHAKHSLRKLRLTTGIERMSCAITLADFEVLKELKIGYDLLLDNRGRKELAGILPPSIEKVDLCRLYTNSHYTVEEDVLEMIIDKAEHLPNLKELTIHLLQNDEDDEGCDQHSDDEGCELPPYNDGLDVATITRTKQKCENVGIRLSVHPPRE